MRTRAGWAARIYSPHSLSVELALCDCGPGFASGRQALWQAASCGRRCWMLSPGRVRWCYCPHLDDLGSAVGFGRISSWRPEPGALVCTPGVCGPLPSLGGGLEEEVLKCVSQVFPSRGGVLAPGWTAQVWCHIGPASVQILPDQAVRPQGSGFSDQPLAPGRW